MIRAKVTISKKQWITLSCIASAAWSLSLLTCSILYLNHWRVNTTISRSRFIPHEPSTLGEALCLPLCCSSLVYVTADSSQWARRSINTHSLWRTSVWSLRTERLRISVNKLVRKFTVRTGAHHTSSTTSRKITSDSKASNLLGSDSKAGKHSIKR